MGFLRWARLPRPAAAPRRRSRGWLAPRPAARRYVLGLSACAHTRRASSDGMPGVWVGAQKKGGAYWPQDNSAARRAYLPVRADSPRPAKTPPRGEKKAPTKGRGGGLFGDLLVEVGDHLIPFGDVGAHGLPERLILAGLEGFDVDALLLAPGEVTEVEDAFLAALVEFDHVVGVESEGVLAEGFGGVDGVELAVEIACEAEVFFGAVHAGAVGGDGHDDVILSEIHVFGGLDGGEDVGDGGESEVFEALDEFGFHAAAVDEVVASGVGVVEGEGVVGGLVGEAKDEVGVHDVVDEGDVFVADALDVVIAESVVEECRAFEGLDRDGFGAVVVLEVVARADGAGGTGGGDEGAEFGVLVGFLEVVEDGAEGRAGAEVVRQVVVELGELVEDEVGGILGEFVTLVVNFLDVGFAPVGGDDVFLRVDGPLAQPVEAFLAHAFGEDGDAAAVHEAADGDAPAAVVAGGRPDGAVFGWVESAQDDARGEAGVCGQNLVGTDHRGQATDDGDDGGVDAGDFLGEDEMHRDFNKALAVGGVVPVHAVEVEGIWGVGVDVGESGLDVVRDQGRIGEFGKGRQGHFAFFETGDGVLEGGFVGNFGGDAKAFENFFHGKSL